MASETDQEGDKVVFNYDPRGLLVSTYLHGRESTTKNVYGYNRMGLRTMMKNNSADTAYATYNAFGQLLTITDPIKNHITYTWDKLGRNTQHTITLV